MKYKVIVMYDKEYEGYIVEVPELVGCMSQGKTFDEALTNIKDAINGWVYVEKKYGRYEDNSNLIEDIFIGEVSV
jgi:predicted RNase H-like HicB family nuclease